MGQHMERTGTIKRKSDNGYVSNISVYQAKNCHECPLKCLCYNAKGDRKIEVNHNLNRHKQKARELLNSEEGLLHRSRRPIEPEAVFGQTKANKHYNRFRHFDKDKVMMDFAIFAIAFNIGKIYRKAGITNNLPSKSRKQARFLGLILFFIPTKENGIEFSTFESEFPKIAA